VPASNAEAAPAWTGLTRSRRSRLGEWLAEKCVLAVALSTVLLILLIFVFVGREALPVVLGRVNSAAAQPAIPPEQMDSMRDDQLRAYLGLSPAEFAAKDRATLRLLMQVRAEAAAEAPADKDARVNTAQWRYLLLPYQWTGYTGPEFIWQPISQVRKYNLVPLLVGSCKTTLVALLFAAPLALAAALYVSQLAPSGLREWLKPMIELLAGVPSVVLGFFALMVMASVLQGWFGYPSRLNAFVAGLALGLASVPVIFSIAEDALSSVPRSYLEGALALGASRWEAAWQVVVPAAAPGVFAALVLGFGRAIGETMVVLMASGNASIMSASLLDSTRTLTATIAAELAETVFGGQHYRVLFLLGLLLFGLTFASNLAGEAIILRLKRNLEGRA
jgi:phosphate transport system permease protein